MKKIPHFDYRTQGDRLIVTKQWKFAISKDDALVINVGFSTNGGSIPRVFWLLLSPFDPLLIEEYTVHDYLCDQKQYARANAWLEQLLIDNQAVAKWKRITVMTGVKFWVLLAYQKASYFDKTQPRVWIKLLKKIKNKGE